MNIKNLMSPSQMLNNSNKFSIKSSKKIKTSYKNKIKPHNGLKLNTKEYESFQKVSRNIFQNETNRLNQTTGYSNPLSMINLREYTTNDSNYQNDLVNYNIANRNPVNSNQIFKKKNLKHNSETGTKMNNQHFIEQKINENKLKQLEKNSSNKFSNDNNLKHLQKFVLNNSALEYPKNLKLNEMKINNSSFFHHQNKLANDEEFISQRMIMNNKVSDEIQQFKSNRQNHNLNYKHRRSKTEKVEELVDYIYDLSNKNNNNNNKKAKNEIIIDNVDDFLNKNLSKKGPSPPKINKISNSKYFVKSPLGSQMKDLKSPKYCTTPKTFKFNKNLNSHSHIKKPLTITKDMINQSNPERKRSLNIYNNNLNISEKIYQHKPKYSLHSEKQQNSIAIENNHEDSTKIKVYDKNGKSYMISRNLLESGKKPQKSLENQDEENQLTNTQRQENLANQIINNEINVLERNIDFPNEDGVFNTTDIDSYAKEFSENEINEKDPNFKDSMKVNPSDNVFIKKNKLKQNFEINENELLSDSEQKQLVNIEKGYIKKFEIFNSRSQEEQDKNPIQEKDNLINNEKQIITSKAKTGKVKIFNLCFDNEADENSNENNEVMKKKVNVSKKDDSGTDFFVVNGKRSQRDIIKPKKVFAIFQEDVENSYSNEDNSNEKNKLFDESHKYQNLDKNLNASSESNNNSLKYLNLSKKQINDSSCDKIQSDKSPQNEDINLLYKKPIKGELNSSSEQSERNLYNRLQSSIAYPKKINDLGGSIIKTNNNKIQLGQNNLQSARMIEDLKKFGKKIAIEQLKKNDISSKKKSNKNNMDIPINNEGKNVVVKRRRGHKRNVHSEQYNDLIHQVVMKHDIPVQLEYNNANMTPDLSRNNSLNMSNDENEIPNNKKKQIITVLSSFEKLELSKQSPVNNQTKISNPQTNFLEDENNLYSKKTRKIDFMNIDDDSDMSHIKKSYTNPIHLKEFEERNKKDIKRFEKQNKIDSKKFSPPSEKIPKAPLPTKEISQHTMAKESSKNSYMQYSKNKESLNTSSKKNLSFGQVSGRGSKISITIMTHKSSKNSDFNNNIVISHSLKNSGIHANPNKQNMNVFKIESPDPGSGVQSPSDGIRIEVQEQREASSDNLDRMPTINPKNLTFNPNNQKLFILDNQEQNKNDKSAENTEMVFETDIKDLQIPQMGSSYEDSLISDHSEISEDEKKDFKEITENTFGKGMNIVIKEAKSPNIFDESLNLSSHIANKSEKIIIQSKYLIKR